MTHQPSWDDWDRWCDARIAAALAADREKLLDHVYETVGEVLGKLVKELKTELETLETKLGHIENLVRSLPTLPEREPIDLPAPRSWRDGNVN